MCHPPINKDKISLNFKDRQLKRSIQINRKVFQHKSLELSQLNFSSKLFISESICYENQQLTFKCRHLKNSKKVHSTWFWNKVVSIKITLNGEIHQISHTSDIEKVLGIKKVDDFINNTFLWIKYFRIFHIELFFL